MTPKVARCVRVTEHAPGSIIECTSHALDDSVLMLVVRTGGLMPDADLAKPGCCLHADDLRSIVGAKRLR